MHVYASSPFFKEAKRHCKESHTIHLSPLTFSSLHCFPTSEAVTRSTCVTASSEQIPSDNSMLFFLYCVCDSPVIVKVVSVLHQGPLTAGHTDSHTHQCVSLCVFASRLKHRMTLSLDLTLILLMAATISIRLLGLGTSRLPTYCNKHANTHTQSISVRYCPMENSCTINIP